MVCFFLKAKAIVDAPEMDIHTSTIIDFNIPLKNRKHLGKKAAKP